MKVLVLGGGGREHALTWKIAQSPDAERTYCIPGNAGISGVADCHTLSLDDFSGIASFVKKESIDLTIVGPEAPLVGGISDYFNKEGLAIFAPSKSAARLEGSKVFSKQMMGKYGIPTADFEIFSESENAIKYIRKKGAPIVVKTDGLAAGKGAIVAGTVDEAVEAVHGILDEKVFGKAGEKIVVEDYLTGEEVSVLAFVDERSVVTLISSQDHKQAYDGDRGPNTGGMGAYSPAPLVTPALEKKIHEEVFARLLKGLKNEGVIYNGILYAGLMICNGSPYVLEFNVRFGDPETQAILPLMETDLLEVITACVQNRLNGVSLKWKKGSCICVVLASGGYPGKYEKGKEVSGLEAFDDRKEIVVFHAGTEAGDGKILTSGGRVTGITAVGKSIEEARKKVYAAVENIRFEGMHYRKDIGLKALKYKG